MLERFSYFGQSPYNDFILKNWVSKELGNVEDGPVKKIVESNLMGSAAVVKSIRSSGQETNNAIIEGSANTIESIEHSSSQIESAINEQINVDLFGHLLISGTIALSTYLINKKMDKISIGIDRLGAQFSEGFSLITSQLDIQTNKLDDINNQLEKINETLSSPLITQAKEFRKLGIDRMNSGLWPEAIDSFCKAINLDETDPISHLMLGKLYLDAYDEDTKLYDSVKSVEHFSKSVRYSKGLIQKAQDMKEVLQESLFMKASAQLALSFDEKSASIGTETNFQSLNGALNSINQLLTINPEHLQGIYLKSKICVILGNESEAISTFLELINKDPQFASVTQRDPDFYLHTEIGKKVISAIEAPLREMINNEINYLFQQLDELRRLSIALPEDTEKWLLDQGFVDKQKTLDLIASKEFTEITNPDRPLYTVIQICNSRLNGLFRKGQESIEKQLSEKLENTRSTINRTSRTFIDIETNEDRILDEANEICIAIESCDPRTMTRDEIDANIKRLDACFANVNTLCQKAETLNRSFEEAKYMFKSISGGRVAAVVGKAAVFALLNPFAAIGSIAGSMTKNGRWSDPQGQKTIAHIVKSMEHFNCSEGMKKRLLEKLYAECG